MAHPFEDHGEKFTPDQIHGISDKPGDLESHKTFIILAEVTK